jgi:hypothetical protein
MEFALLAVLCPIGMGLMMWFMAKGMSMGRGGSDAGSQGKEQTSLEELRAEQERLASRIDEVARDEASISSPR